MKCIFCDIIKGKEKSHIVWNNRRFYAFLDKRPIKKGHVLLVPKKHIKDVESMTEKQMSDFFLEAKFLMPSIQRAMKSKRVALAVEGFGINHTHLHLVPVNKGNDLNPLKAKSVSENVLTTVQKSLIAQIKKQV